MKHIWVSALLLLVSTTACSSGGGDDGDDTSAGSGAGAGGGAAAQDPKPSSGQSGGDAMSGDGGGSANAGDGAAGASGSAAAGAEAGAAGSAMAGSSAAGSGASGFKNVGVCGRRGQGTVTETEYMATEEFYIISEEGFGEDICVVRFDAKRAGEAPEGCDDPAGDVDCLWTHLVELSNPTTVTDVDGVCAKSELALDMAKIAELDGSRAGYGFVSEFAGHNSVLMKYDEATKAWDADANANWNDEDGAFRFDSRNGVCMY